MFMNILAGLLAGVVTITYSLSYAAFLFSGKLSQHLSVGILSALLSACCIAFVVSLFSSFPFAIAGPDSNSTAILALMATAIIGNIPPGKLDDYLLPTIWLGLVIFTVVTGIFLFILGRLHLGRLIRFIPYPVVGGFLAATGWLILQGSFRVMSGVSLKFGNLNEILEPPGFWLCLAGVSFASVLLVLVRRFKHFLILPIMLILGGGGFYLALYYFQIPLADARAQGWLFKTMASASFNPWAPLDLARTDWWVLLNQITNLLAMVAVVAMTILLNASGLELATMTDAELDRELQAAGLANVVAGAFGGMVGYLSISRSLLNFEAGGRSRLSGIVAAGLCVGLIFAGPSVLLYIPKPLLGGLLCYLGLALLFEWLVDSRKRLSRFDYFLVVTILLFVSIWDFLTAVGLGTVIACLLFAFNYSRVRVVKHALSCKEHRSNVVRSLHEQELLHREGERIGIFCLQGYIFFGTVSNLISDVRERIEDTRRHSLDFLILDFRLVSGVDSSALLSFLKMKRLAQKRHFMLIFTHIDIITQQKLRQSGVLIDGDHTLRIYPDLDRGLEFCENLLLLELSGSRTNSVSLATQINHAFDDKQSLPRLLRYMEQLSIEKGKILFHQGDPADALYFIESGTLTVTLHRPGGKWKRLATIGPGTIVGEIGLFLNRDRTASVVTEEPVTLYRLKRNQFQAMQTDDPDLALAFQQAIIRLLSNRLIQANKELDILLK